MGLKVSTVAVLKDNYSYVLIDEAKRLAVVIDPPVVEPLVEVLRQESLGLQAIWLTHHHADHVAGVPGLLKEFGQVPVLCSQRDANRIEGVNRTVKEGDVLEFAGFEARVMELPGHAEGHIAFHFPESGDLFCGDVIFGASCGAVFGDTHKEMFHSVRRVTELPGDTRLWVGHEYTRNNLRFAEAVLGEDALKTRRDAFQEPSVPLHLAEEQRTNPFMMLESPQVQGFLGLCRETPEATFKALRLAKDRF